MPGQGTVFFDRDCGFCQRSVGIVRALDWLRAFRFVPLQSDEASALGLKESENLSQMVFARQQRRWGGWRAVKRILFRLPIVYAGLAALLAAPAVWPALTLPAVALLLLIGLSLSPLCNPAGDALYRWIARNRHRLPGSTCSLENR
ncbi:MAG: DUF393 domain-containing protein [Bryobacterales bacterium]|nr:DUF393 domain-containing protein [Bryobacterales bacterium]